MTLLLELREDVKETVRLMASLAVAQEAIRKDQVHLFEELTKLSKVVLEGNGHQPMTVRLASVEEKAHAPGECRVFQSHLESHAQARRYMIDLKDRWTLSVLGGFALLVFKDEVWPLLQEVWMRLHWVLH